MIGWYLLVVALAAYRLTRVVTTDSITEPFRDWLYRWAWDDEHAEVTTTAAGQVLVPASRGALRTWINELLNCPWCLGVWVSAGVFSAWRWWATEPVRAIIVVAAVAGAQGFIASRRDA